MTEDDDNAFLIGNMMGHVDEQQINSDPQDFSTLHHNFDANIDHIDPSVFIAPEVEERNESEEQEISSSYQPNTEQCNQTLRRFTVPGTLHPNPHPSFVGYQSFGPLCHSALPFQYTYSTPFVPFSMQGHPSTVGFSQPQYQQMLYGRMLQSDVGHPPNVSLSDNGHYNVGQSSYQGLPSFDSSLRRFINPIYLDENSNGMNSDISLSTPETSLDNSYNTFNFVEPYSEKPISEASNEGIEHVSKNQFVSDTSLTDSFKLESGKDEKNVTEYELFEDNCSLLSEDEDEIGTREVSSPVLSKANTFQPEKSAFEDDGNLLKVSIINSNDEFSPKSSHVAQSIKGRRNSFKPFVYRPKAFRHKNIFSYKDLSGNIVETNKQSATVFQCKLCDYSSNNKSNFRNHLFIHSDERQFACPYCPYKGKQSAGLRAHLKVHSVDKPYTCMYCPYKCKRKQNLIQHLRIHSKCRPFHCQTCSYCTTTKQALQKHCCRHLQSNVLDPKTEYVQEPESKVRPSDVNDKKVADNLTEKHLSGADNTFPTSPGADNTLAKENWFSCLDCSYECSHREQMDNHSKSHLEDNVVSSTQENSSSVKQDAPIKVKNTIFNCPDCEFTSARKCAMGNHVKTHEKNYFCCPLCVFKSRTAGSLRLHLNTHSRSRKPKSLLKCTYCEFDTFNPDVYVSHAKEHKINFISQKSKADIETKALDKFYQCPYCAYDCLIFSTFKLHIANHSEDVFRKFNRTLKKKTDERPTTENLPSSSSAMLNVCLKDNHELEIANFSKPTLDKVSPKPLNVKKQQSGRSILKCKSTRAYRCAKRARLRILRHQKTETASKFQFRRKLAVHNYCQSNSGLQPSSDDAETKYADSEKCLTLKRKFCEDQSLSNGILKLSHLDGSQNRVKLLKSKVKSRFTGNATPESMKNIICALQTVRLQDAQNGKTSFDPISNHFENKFLVKPNIIPFSNEQSISNGYASQDSNFGNYFNETSDSLLQFDDYAISDAFSDNEIVVNHGLSTHWESKYKTFRVDQDTKSTNYIQDQISNKEFKFLKLDQNFQMKHTDQRANLKAETIHEHSLTDSSNIGCSSGDTKKCDHINLGIFEHVTVDDMDSGTCASNEIEANFHNQLFANEPTFKKDYESVAETILTLSEDLKKSTTCDLFNVTKVDHNAENDSFGSVSKHLIGLQYSDHHGEDIACQKSISKVDSCLAKSLTDVTNFEGCLGNNKYNDNPLNKSLNPVEIDNKNSSEALEISKYNMEKGVNLSEEFHFEIEKSLEQNSAVNEKHFNVKERYAACSCCEKNSTDNEVSKNDSSKVEEHRLSGDKESNYKFTAHENNLPENFFMVNKQDNDELQIDHFKYNDDELNLEKEKVVLFPESGTPLLERCLTSGFNPYCESAVEFTNSNNTFNTIDMNVEKIKNANLCNAGVMDGKLFEFEEYCERLHQKTSACESSYEESEERDSRETITSTSGIIYNSVINEELQCISHNEDTNFANSFQANLNGIDSDQPVTQPSTVYQDYLGTENSKTCDKVHENVESNKINLLKTKAKYDFHLHENYNAYASPEYEPVGISSNDTAHCGQKDCSLISFSLDDHKGQSPLNDLVKMPQTNPLFGIQASNKFSAKDVPKFSAPKISIIKFLKVGENNLLAKLATSSGNSLIFNTLKGSKTYKLNISSCSSTGPSNIITSESIEGSQNIKLSLPHSDSDLLKIGTGHCDIGLKFKKCPQLILPKLDASNIMENCDKSVELPDGSMSVAKIDSAFTLNADNKINDADCVEAMELMPDCVDPKLSDDLTVDVRTEDDSNLNNAVDHQSEVLNNCQPSASEITEKSTKYFCHICNKTFARKSSFSNHCKSHKKSVFKCNSCTFTCKQKQMFFEHQRTEHEGKRHYNCKKCDFSSTRKCTLMTHSKIHTNFFSCKVCTFSCKSKLELDEHYFTHRKEYVCSLCSYVCQSTKELYEHNSLAHKKSNKCTECSFKALTMKEVNEHRASVHTKVLIKCHSCNYETNSALFLKFHMKKHLKDNIFLTCKECKYVADSKLDLYNHSSSHISKNDYNCSFCDDIFANNSEFKDHLFKIHSIKTINS